MYYESSNNYRHHLKKNCKTLCNLIVPEISLPPPREGFSHPLPQPLWKFQYKLDTCFICFGLREPPTPWEIPIPSVGEYGYFLELHIFKPQLYCKYLITHAFIHCLYTILPRTNRAGMMGYYRLFSMGILQRNSIIHIDVKYI